MRLLLCWPTGLQGSAAAAVALSALLAVSDGFLDGRGIAIRDRMLRAREV